MLTATPAIASPAAWLQTPVNGPGVRVFCLAVGAVGSAIEPALETVKVVFAVNCDQAAPRSLWRVRQR